ncbi:MAG TPA: MBL fold metallo-hydrolase [Ilumatobacteraceae bacterium]|nr:MBL fold metallo-hydrolase [Ilumatobacteraceae bacterium]
MDAVEFLTLDRESFVYGASQPVAPLVRRVIAENPSKFTYFGTGTYIVGGDANGRGDVVVIDPGPRLDAHRDALGAALDGCSVKAILVTHCHSDHSPLAAWLTAESGAPTIAFGPHGDDTWDIGDDPPGADPPGDEPDADGEPVVEESTDRAFTPDLTAASGDVVAAVDGWVMTALHTPGHTSNHTCFALDDGTTRTLFTGDHVMGWSTTVVSPPDGDMAAYLESLRVVAGRRDDVAIPTHGPPIPDPSAFVNGLIEHRLQREAQVLAAVRSGIDMIPAMVEVLYVDVRKELHKPARRSVLAHLVKLVDDGVVAIEGDSLPRLDSHYRPA